MAVLGACCFWYTDKQRKVITKGFYPSLEFRGSYLISLAIMRSEIARVIHLTDMHLFVDSRGHTRSLNERKAIVNIVLWLAGQKWGKWGILRIADGLNSHSATSLKTFVRTLQPLVIAPRHCPLIVVQSGDVEAYGGSKIAVPGSTGLWSFPSFDYWQAYSNSIASSVDSFVNIYGNHDVWPGNLPLFQPWDTSSVEQSIRRRPEFSGQLPDSITQNNGPYRLEFYRLNTIQSHCLRNTFAEGHASADSNMGSDPATALSGLAKQNSTGGVSQLVIRILVMHHPPHFFGSTSNTSDLTEGLLTNAVDLLPAFQGFRFHIVLAGHRHKLDPAFGSSLDPSSVIPRQSPLPASTVQLVTGSATQFVAPGHGNERPSFSVYSLWGDDYRREMFVERTLYRLRNDLDSTFTPEPKELIVKEFSIL